MSQAICACSPKSVRHGSCKLSAHPFAMGVAGRSTAHEAWGDCGAAGHCEQGRVVCFREAGSRRGICGFAATMQGWRGQSLGAAPAVGSGDAGVARCGRSLACGRARALGLWEFEHVLSAKKVELLSAVAACGGRPWRWVRDACGFSRVSLLSSGLFAKWPVNNLQLSCVRREQQFCGTRPACNLSYQV